LNTAESFRREKLYLLASFLPRKKISVDLFRAAPYMLMLILHKDLLFHCNVHVFCKLIFSNRLGFILETSLFLKLFRFYFDPATNSCITFIYTGCGGNGNRFESKADCLSTCSTNGNGNKSLSFVTSFPRKSADCLLPIVEGSCKDMVSATEAGQKALCRKTVDQKVHNTR